MNPGELYLRPRMLQILYLLVPSDCFLTKNNYVILTHVYVGCSF